MIHKYHKWVSILSIHGQIKSLEGQIKSLEGHSPLPQGGSRRLAPLLGFAAGGVPQISSNIVMYIVCYIIEVIHAYIYNIIYSLHVYMIICVIICIYIYNTIISSMSIVITCSLTILNGIRNIIITTIKLICM